MTAPLVERVFTPALDDRQAQADLERQGVAVLGEVLDRAARAELRRRFDELGSLVAPLHGDRWFTTGALAEPSAKRRVYEAVGELVRPSVRGLVRPGVEVLAGNYHVNPARSAGGIGPHQDVALVDEAAGSTVNCWIPLDDVGLDDGPLHFVAGSHRFGNAERSLARPWSYDGLHELFWEFARPVEVPAGHLVAFDTAAVHCSTANLGPTPRIAVNCLLVPEVADLRHLVATPAGDEVDVYAVTPGFLIEGDLRGVPGPDDGRWIERRPARSPVVDEGFVRRQCRAGAARLDGGVGNPPVYPPTGG